MDSIRQRYALPTFACILCVLAGATVQAQTYVFGTAAYPTVRFGASSPPSGGQPVVTADLNKDDIPDVVTLGQSSGDAQVLSVFLGKQDGTFGPRTDYAVQGTGFALGDFNGDGRLDVVVVGNTAAPNASVLLGNGDGTFQAPVPLVPNIGSGYTAVAAADLNGDGKLDLAVLTPNFGSGATLAVLLGNGDESFQTPVTYSVPAAPYLALADFNSDGRPDIAVTGPIYGGQANQLSVLLNNGDGTFQAPVNYPVAGIVEALAAADVNGDGKLDLIVPTGGSSASVSVLLGNGDGTFGNPIVYTNTLLDLYSSQVAAADFNGDGKLDLALTNSQTNDIAILRGNGDGTFQSPPQIYNAGLQASAVIALDANGDNKPDLAVAGGYGSDYLLTVLINRGDGSFPNRITFPVLPGPYAVVAGDLNGDGKPDLVTTSFTQSGGVSTLMGNGDGTFQQHLDSPTGQNGYGAYPNVMAAGDFNNDHTLDLVVADSQKTSTGVIYPVLASLTGKGDGTFQNSNNQILSNIEGAVAAGDFNNDGNLDIAAAASNTNYVSIFLGNGNGTFASPASVSVGPMLLSPPYHNVLAGDFNSDGRQDLAVATDNGVAVLLGNGDATFQAPNIIPSMVSTDPGDELLAVGDFNGDGKLDIVKGTQTDIINVALGNGDGTFQNAQGLQFPSILNFESAAVGDLNGDGKLDVAFVSQSSNLMTVVLGNGDGTFCCQIHYDAGSISNNVRFMTAADFNGDGAADLAFANFGDSTISVFVNAPVSAFAPRQLTFANQEVGSTSAAQIITLANPGAAPLDITNISTTGDFAETTDCPTKLGNAQSCQIRVTFSPTSPGVRSGTATFSDNASVVPQILNLSGTGLPAPAVTLSTASVTFPSQATGMTSVPQTVTLTDSGTANLTFSTSAVTIIGTNEADFAIASDGCSGQSIAPSGICSVGIVFKPSTAGSKSATLSLADDAPNSPQTVSLAGTAATPDFSIAAASGSSTSATIAPGGTASYELSASPVAGFNQTISFACTGAPALANCSVSPSSLTLDGIHAASVSVSISTTASAVLEPPAPNPPPATIWIVLLGLLACASVALLFRRRPRVAWIALVPLLFAVAVFSTSCGRGASSKPPPSSGSPGTPVGAYTIVVTGISGSLSHSQNLALVVN